jgi:uncharacterized integral membrane protein
MEHVSKLVERLGERLRPEAPQPKAEQPASTPELGLVPGRARSHELGMWWTFGAGLVVAGAVIVAIVQNGQRVRLDFLVWHTNVSLIVAVLTTALIAVFVDEVGGLVWRRRRRSSLGRRNELEQLRAEKAAVDEAAIAVEAPPAPR